MISRSKKNELKEKKEDAFEDQLNISMEENKVIQKVLTRKMNLMSPWLDQKMVMEEILPLVADVIITKLLWLIMHERDKKRKISWLLRV